MGAEITFKRPDGGDAKGYLDQRGARRRSGRRRHPGMVGSLEQIKATCDRFALAGFDALAPDLFKGVVVPYHDTERAQKEMMSLKLHRRDRAERARRGPVSQAQWGEGRHRRLLHGRGGGDHRGGENPRA